jgi:Fe-S cluster assembly ATP-binding protein
MKMGDDNKGLIAKDLGVQTQGKQVLKEINLEIKPGEVHYLVGKNGSGKSSLGKVIMGYPQYKILQVEVYLQGEKINDLSLTKRSLKGIFLAHQYPLEVPGVSLFNFLKQIYNARLPKEDQIATFKFKKILLEKFGQLNIPKSFINRTLNEGFSGGEKKKVEVLQMLLLEPKLVILDEVDSGLDINATKEVFQAIKDYKETHKRAMFLIISHRDEVARFLPPQKVHFIRNGEIEKTGDEKYLAELMQQGFN